MHLKTMPRAHARVYKNHIHKYHHSTPYITIVHHGVVMFGDVCVYEICARENITTHSETACPAYDKHRPGGAKRRGLQQRRTA